MIEVQHPAMIARRITTLILKSKINLSTEAAAHRDIATVLEGAGLEFQSEVRLSNRDRIDLLCGTVGIEVKVGHSRREIWRQLQRYARHDRIEALVLATGTAFPSRLSEVDGVPLYIAGLSRGWL